MLDEQPHALSSAPRNPGNYSQDSDLGLQRISGTVPEPHAQAAQSPRLCSLPSSFPVCRECRESLIVSLLIGIPNPVGSLAGSIVQK